MKKRMRMVVADNYQQLERLVNSECEAIEKEGNQVLSLKVWESETGLPTACIIHSIK